MTKITPDAGTHIRNRGQIVTYLRAIADAIESGHITAVGCLYLPDKGHFNSISERGKITVTLEQPRRD